MEPSAGAGAGGKIRRRPTHRAAATPYDRPPAAAAAHRLAAAAAAAADAPGGEGGGWVSRLVDPASRLIAGGAARLFSTVFRKRFAPAPALAPPHPPLSTHHGRDTEPKQDLPESTHTSSIPILEGGMEKAKNPAGTSDDKALSEVEHLLMRKTFTRVEFDRLTDLLRTRTVESDVPAQLDYHDDKNESRARIDGIRGSTSHGMDADHSFTADVPLRGVSSPAELAKQYMSSRHLRESQPNSLRSRVFLENKGEASNTAYDRRGFGAPAVQELNGFGNANLELSVNGYATPELRGRSAIYRMSRSPFFKGPSSSSDMNVPPFHSSQARPRSLVASSRQALKRRVTDFENELGSIGPIRRIRQKSNMMSPLRDAHVSPRENFLPSRTIGSDFTAGSSPVQESPNSKRLLLGTGQSLRPVEAHGNGEDGKSSSDNVPPVPPESNKMAEKILEQLNRIAPSPKEEQSGEQSVAENASCFISKQPVWQDNRRNSVADPPSSLQFQDLDGVNQLLDPDLNGSPLNKDKMTKNGSSKVPPYLLQELGNKDIKSDHVAISDKPAILRNSLSASTSQKPGFKMAVFEDLLEFDDDQEAPVPSKNSSSKTELKTIQQKFDSNIKEMNAQPNILEQKVESNILKEKVVSPVNAQPMISPLKDVSSSGLFSSNDTDKKATSHVSVDNNSSFAFPHAPPGASPETTVAHASNKDNKLTSASPFTFGVKQSSSSDLETTASAKTNTRVEESEPDTLDDAILERGNESERAEDAHKSSVESSSGASTSTAPRHSASAASTSPGLLSNGFSHSLSPKLSNVSPTDKSAVSPAVSTTVTTFAVSSSSPSISASPAFPASRFGSSTSAAAAKSDSTNTEAKQDNSLSFGTWGTTAAAKSIVPDIASKTTSNLNDAPISSNVTSFSSSPVASSTTFLSTATFSSSPAASSSGGTASTNSTLSSTLSAAPGIQSASSTPFTFLSSENSAFGFSTPAQPTGLSTSIASSTSQPSATGTIFGSKLPQSEGTMSQPSQSSATLFSSPFPAVIFGGASSVPGAVSTGVGTSSTGSRTLSSIVGASSPGPGTVPFGAGASTSRSGTASSGLGVSTSGPVTASQGVGASSSGLGTFSFGAGGSSSGPVTESFGVTTSSSGSGFGNSPFGSGANFSSAGSGFAFSTPSSSAGSSLAVASTSMFSSSSLASSSPAFSNPFGSSSSPPNMFTFGQSASSGGGFSFGVQSAAAFTSHAPVFSFTSASASMNSSSPQPVFGSTNNNTVFSMGSSGNDQMNVEDSMADDTNQAAPTPVSAPVFGSSPFGAQGSSSAAPVFGAPAVHPGGVFQFGSQQGSVQQNQSFPAGGSLDFQGGNFSLGSGGGGGDKSSRRMIKVKRGAQKKR